MTDEGSLVSRRKRAGIMSMTVGIPNLLIAVPVALGGIAVTVILGVLAFRLMAGDGSDDPIRDLCLVFVLMLVLIMLVVAVALTVLSVLFAFAVAGQTIGGWRAYKGINYGGTLTLIFLGSGAALLAGVVLILYALASELDGAGPIAALLVGIFEMVSFGISLASGIMLVGTRETFVRKERKGIRQKLKDRKKHR